MLLPPILFHLPTQVYSMQPIIVHNMVGPPAPTQTVEGHSLGGVSLLCKNTQVAPLPSTYPSLQHRSQKGGRSLPHMAAT